MCSRASTQRHQTDDVHVAPLTQESICHFLWDLNYFDEIFQTNKQTNNNDLLERIAYIEGLMV